MMQRLYHYFLYLLIILALIMYLDARRRVSIYEAQKETLCAGLRPIAAELPEVYQLCLHNPQSLIDRLGRVFNGT